MTAILITVAVLGGLGLLLGLFLCFSDKLFFVASDERVEKIRELLPGSNCGGCGYAGCDALAEAMAKGEAPTNACVGCDESCLAALAAITGGSTERAVRRVAHVACSGTCDKIHLRYQYYGSDECHRVAVAPGRGGRRCAYGCIGFGSCVKACDADAIHVINGCAVVSPEVCIGCGRCVAACPNGLISLIPLTETVYYTVDCRSREKGKNVRQSCEAGCIGCGLCARVCTAGAVSIENNIAKIDPALCTGCGLCAQKCPAKVIRPIGAASRS